MKRKNGLNDSDRLMVTVALWIALVSLFATSLTLHMLPNSVRTSVYTFDPDDPEAYSKYGNLFIVSASVIPVLIVLIVATLKKHNRMQHNFASMLIFCIMMSVCMSGLTIFGIVKQMIATPVERPLDPFTMSAVAITIVLSLACALIPRLFRTNFFRARTSTRSPFMTALCDNVDRFWNIGAYGYILTGVFVSFIPLAYAFIPLGVFLAAHAAMLITIAKIKSRKKDSAKPVEESDAKEAVESK